MFSPRPLSMFKVAGQTFFFCFLWSKRREECAYNPVSLCPALISREGLKMSQTEEFLLLWIFQKVHQYFRKFRNVPWCFRRFQNVSESFRMLINIPEGFRTFQNVQESFEHLVKSLPSGLFLTYRSINQHSTKNITYKFSLICEIMKFKVCCQI